MKLYHLTYLSSLYWILFNLYLCRNFVFVRHPDLIQYFEEVSLSTPQVDHGLGLLSKGEKISKCREIVRATVYESVPPTQDLPQPSSPGMRNLEMDIEELYNCKVLRAIQQIDVTVELVSRVVIVPSLPCILSADFAWFLTPGFNENEYFAIGKVGLQEHFQIHGIIEPWPKVKKKISNDQFQLEAHFLKNLKSAIERRGQKRNFCDLQKSIRFRLCSSGHRVWRESTNQSNIWEIFKENFAHSEIGLCIRNAQIVFRSIPFENIDFSKSVRTDVISCSSNVPWTEPQFYLAADQNTLDAAYILQIQNYEGESVEPMYQLFQYLKNIPALKNQVKVVQTLYEITS